MNTNNQTKGDAINIEMTGRFSSLIEDSVFWYYRDQYNRPNFSIDLRTSLVERLTTFMSNKDDVADKFFSIGFGTQADRDAIEAEERVNVDEDFDYVSPIRDDFEERGFQWLATTDGLESVLNYDACSGGLVMPLADAIANRDELPIFASQFAELLVDCGYAVEVEND